MQMTKGFHQFIINNISPKSKSNNEIQYHLKPSILQFRNFKMPKIDNLTI